MAPAWAAGLTVTTTGLNQHEKQAVKDDVEAAGGRYSPNLSKRTTHLVTPDVVGSLSDKLAAAAAAGSRFSAHIVSLGWVSASAASRGKAAEVQYTPALPGTTQTPGSHSEPATPATHLSSASSTCRMQHGRSVASAAAPTPGAAAAAAPQTPWVVHFSQMVDDSVYGMPEHPSPTAHERLAEQLQEQQYQEQQLLLQPIAEEQSQDVSPAPACLPLQQHAAFSPGVSPAATAAVHGTVQQQVAAEASLQQTTPAAAGTLTPSSRLHGTPQHRPHVLLLPGMMHVLDASRAQQTATPAAAAAASEQHPALVSEAGKSRAAFGNMLAPPAAANDQQTSNVHELLVNLAGNRYSNLSNSAPDVASCVMGGAVVQHAGTTGYRDSTAAAVTVVGAPVTVQHQVHQVLGEVQQQGWQRQQQLQQPVPADVSGGCGSVDELISALRRVTTDGRRSTSEFTTSPMPAVTLPPAATAAAAAPGHGHPSPLQQQQWQSPAARGARAAAIGVVPSFGSMRHKDSTVDELIGALQRVADSSKRSSIEAAPEAGGMVMPAEQQQGAAADGSLLGSFNSVDDLIVVLRRATSDNARTATATQGAPQGSQHLVTTLSQQQQQRWPWAQTATTPQQQQQEAQQRSAYAADCPVPVTPSNVDELILALRRATGDSRRSTAEAAPSSPGGARWEPQQLWMGQQGSPQLGGLQAGGLFGSMESVDDLLGALRQATGDSRRGTAEPAPDASAGTDDTAAAAAAGVVAAKQKAASEQIPGVPAAMTAAGRPAEFFGSLGSVDDLLGALRRATSDSRRGTAESAPDASAGTDDTAAAAAAGAAAAKQKAASEQSPGVPAAMTAAGGPAELCGSFSSVDDLLGALRQATTDSRRNTAESALDAHAGTADKCAAAMQRVELKQDAGVSAAAPANGPAGLFGSMSSVDDLLGALRQVTGDSRRGTAESEIDAPAGTADTCPAAAVLGALAKRKAEEEQALCGTAAAAGEAAEPAGLYGSLSSVDDLIQALRRATGDGRRDTRELVLDTGGGAAAATYVRQQQQQQQQDEVGDQQLQQSMAASQSLRRSSLSSCSNFEDVLGALLRATASSRRGTAEAVAEAAAVPLDSQPTQQQQQHAHWQPQSTPADKQPGTAGYSPGHMSGSSINALVNSLRGVTGETQGQLKTAAEAVAPPPPQPAAAAAGDTPAAAAGNRADMQELVAALRRVTGEDHMAGCSNAGAADSLTPSRLLLTPQAGSPALSRARHEQEQQQQQHAALIQQLLLLHTQPGQRDEQLHIQQHGGSGSYFKAAWGSSGGEEAPAATAGVAGAATSSGGVEQLLAALRRSTISGGVPAVDAADNQLYGEAARHAEVDCATSQTSAAQLAFLLQGQQQQQQQQQQPHWQQASATRELKQFGASSCCTPDSTTAVLDSLPADHAAAASAQQQEHSIVTEELSVSQSPLRARQLWHAEASPGAAGGCNQTELSLSQLVHALQSTGDQPAGREVKEAPSPSAPTAYTASTAAAGAAAAAAGAEDSKAWSGPVRTVAAAAADADPDDATDHSDVNKFSTSTPPEEEQLPAAAEPPQQQQQQQAAADSAEAVAAAQPQQQQQEQPMPAAAAASAGHPPDQQASAAATGLQPCSISSMAVVFDHRLPAELRKELAAAVTAAGGCVVPGQPHLGCGADTVVAEPQHAAQWLQLLMHIVSPAWLLKACRQQQQQGCRPQQQLMCLSPDVARALGQGQGGEQQGGHTGVKQHADAATGADDSGCAAGGLVNHCSSARSPEANTAAAHSLNSSRTVAATAQVSGDCDVSSSKAQRALLTMPGALSVDGMGLWGMSAVAGAGVAGQVQQQPLLMPPGLLEGVVWSVDQDPRSVGDEEAEAVILQGSASSITLLLPQDSSGLLGHAPVLVSACQPCKGLTCSDVLQAIHSFYQQEVLLQQQPAAAAAGG